MAAMNLDQLSGSLSAPLQVLYVIHGEEDLLRIEALDLLRAAAKKQGYRTAKSIPLIPILIGTKCSNQPAAWGCFLI